MNRHLMELLSPITDEEQKILSGQKAVEKKLYSDSPDFTVQSSKMIENQLISMRCHTRFIEFPRHSHDYIEMIYMCSGKTSHRINDSTNLVLKQGEILLLNQYATHSIEPAGQNDIAVNFMMRPAFFDTAFDMMEEESPLRTFLTHALKSRHSQGEYMVLRVSDILPVQNLIENLIWSVLEKKTDNDVDRLTLALLFLNILDHTEQVVETNDTAYDTTIILSVLSYIEKYYQDASLSCIAQKLELPMSHLSRLIKSRTGKTFKEILMEQRLRRAEHLILHSKLPICDIIAAVGYNNSSYFYRIFREKYGLSPAEYKNSIHANQDVV